MARTLLLDLDGTIVDTVPDIAAALNRLTAKRKKSRRVTKTSGMLSRPGFSAESDKPSLFFGCS